MPRHVMAGEQRDRSPRRTYAQYGSTTSPLELSWQTAPTALYPAGHCSLAADRAVAVTDRRLTAQRASVSLRIV
jgi:hypothetical protein